MESRYFSHENVQPGAGCGDNCFEAAMGVVYRPDFEDRLRAHFDQGGASSTDDVAWYALRNTVYASGCRQLLLKNGTVTYAEAQRQASRLFENAVLVHTDLIYGPSGLEAARAIVAMTFYAETAADQGFEYMISASAVRRPGKVPTPAAVEDSQLIRD